jgi:hypothetical protein
MGRFTLSVYLKITALIAGYSRDGFCPVPDINKSEKYPSFCFSYTAISWCMKSLLVSCFFLLSAIALKAQSTTSTVFFIRERAYEGSAVAFFAYMDDQMLCSPSFC